MGENWEGISYTYPIEIDGNFYIILLQCRVKPISIRVPDLCYNEYYIINDPDNIRPYGLIVQKMTKQERDDYCNQFWPDL